MQVVTPNQGNCTLTNVYTIVQENASEKSLGPQSTETCQISNEDPSVDSNHQTD